MPSGATAPVQADLEARLVGHRLGVPARRGKYLLGPDRDTDEAMVAPRYERAVPGRDRRDPAGPHLRVVLGFGEGPDVRFVDQRTFGGIAVEPFVDGVPASVQHIALDPFDPATTSRGRSTGCADVAPS